MQIPRERILGVREDARLREQDFGNFQVSQELHHLQLKYTPPSFSLTGRQLS